MKRILASVGVIVLLPLLSTAQVPTYGVVAKIDFAFHAGTTVLQAGTYEFKPSGEPVGETVSVIDRQTRKAMVLPVVTTISKKLSTDGEIVFDRTATDYYLTEVFIPGADGYLLKGAPGKHTHVSIKAAK